MSLYIQYKLWKFGVLIVLAFLIGFYRGGKR